MSRSGIRSNKPDPPEATGSSVFDSPAFEHIDRHFAHFLERLAGGPNPHLLLAAALVSRSRGQGNSCLDLRAVASTMFPEDASVAGQRWALPEADAWLAALRATSVVGRPGEFKPLILDDRGRLYLQRYWEHESDLATAIEQRAAQDTDTTKHLPAGFDRFFPPATGETAIDWQKIAVLTALRKRFCVISGGPGTGKTRTAAVILALLFEQSGGRPLRVALAAPTGKAAARLQESIRKLGTELPCEAHLRQLLPQEAFTLHRLLGGSPDSVSFRYHADNPLPYDVVLVDEASMVDLALMARLFAAIPREARVILLGDKDQLASVEAGAVLGDICRAGESAEEVRSRSGHRQTDRQSRAPASAPVLEATTDKPRAGPLAECVVQLRRNYRFGAENGILALSQAINQGDADLAVSLVSGGGERRDGVEGTRLPAANQMKEQLRERVLAAFGGVVRAEAPWLALQALSRFRILCALREGPFGAKGLNQLVEEILEEAGMISTRGLWYGGQPVMVTRNDYNLRLFNGDTGIVLPNPGSGEPQAWFAGADQSLRSVPLLRLPEHESVFAMTVHKSQGSEFERVLFILPDRESPVLTRELLYTGVTRASRRVELWFEEAVLRQAVSRKVARTSGLSDALTRDRSQGVERQLTLPW